MIKKPNQSDFGLFLRQAFRVKIYTNSKLLNRISLEHSILRMLCGNRIWRCIKVKQSFEEFRLGRPVESGYFAYSVFFCVIITPCRLKKQCKKVWLEIVRLSRQRLYLEYLDILSQMASANVSNYSI